MIDAAKTIINSNKRGDETFLERFISSDKIETVQDFTANKDQLMDGLDQLYVEGGQTAVIDGVYLAAEHVAEYKNDVGIGLKSFKAIGGTRFRNRPVPGPLNMSA